MRPCRTIAALLCAAALAGCSAGAPEPRPASSAASGSRPSASASARTSGPPIPERFAAWLRLYDEAGFPDVTRAERVDSFTGAIDTSSERMKGARERAWLLRRSPTVRLLEDTLWQRDRSARSEERIRVTPPVPPSMRGPLLPCDDDLCDPTKRREWLKSIPDVEPPERTVDYAAELEEALKEAAKRAANPEAERAPLAFQGDSKLGPLEAFWVARARWAEARGRRDLALRALDEASRSAKLSCRNHKGCDPIEQIREGFQRKLLWEAIEGLGEWMPRAEALDRARRARSIAPKGRHAAQAEELVRSLEQAITEDAQKAKLPPPAWASLTFEQRAGELIFLLREQNGRQMSWPGACDPFDVGREVRNPAQELVDMGRKVIPLLIPSIESAVPTRSIESGRSFFFSHHALTVGEVATDIIERVSGKTFRGGGKPQAEVRAEAAAWWARVATMSDKDILIDALRSAAPWERATLAHQLLAKAGMDAWNELVQAFRGTQEPTARASLLTAMSFGSRVAMGQGTTQVRNTRPETPGPERDRVVRFLAGALKDAAPEVRRAAAHALVERGDKRGVDAMVRDLAAIKDADGLSSHEVGETLKRLLQVSSPAVVEAILRHVRQGTRVVLEGLAEAIEWVCPASAGAPSPCKLDAPQRDALAEALVAQMLSTVTPFAGGIGGSLQRPRDLAARAFTALRGLPREDAGGSKRSVFEADQAILKKVNAYRTKRKQLSLRVPELELPVPPSTPGPDDHRAVRRVHEQSENAQAKSLGAAWLARFQGKPLDPDALTRDLADLGAKAPSFAWQLRIVRFPEERGVVLFLRGFARDPKDALAAQMNFECLGSGSCSTATIMSGQNKKAAAEYAKDIHAAWKEKALGIEEYAFTVIGET